MCVETDVGHEVMLILTATWGHVLVLILAPIVALLLREPEAQELAAGLKFSPFHFWTAVHLDQKNCNMPAG